MQTKNQTAGGEPAGFWAGWRKRLRALKNVPPVLKILWEAGGGSVAANAVLRIVAALIPLATLGVGKQIIDLVVQTARGGGPIPDDLWAWVGLELGLATLGAVLARAIDYVDSLLADKFSRHLSVRTMRHASRLDLASYEDPVFYDKLERARVQATDRLGMIQAMGRLLQLVVTTVSLSAGILVFSPWLLVVLVVCVFPAFLGESHFAFLGYSLSFQQTPVRRQLDYLRVLGASRESAKELKLFGLSDELTDRFRRLSDQIFDQNVALAKRRLWASSLLSLLSIVGYYGCYVWVIAQAAAGEITVGSLTFLAGAIAGASANIQSIFSTFSSIADQALFLTDLLEFFATKPTIRSKPDALPAPRPIREGFVFDDVSFSYPGNDRMVLDGLSFRLEPGQRVALIGENGQGKTTIVKLLTRLYDPTAGRILLDGVDLRNYSTEDLCKQIGVIFQDFMRYEMTALENIAVGRIDGAGDRAEIERAALKSRASEVIARLPKGYDQLLGRRFEGGLDLSGGEWQKIALARAYLRDAQVLVLDEPTAALDARSEYDVFQRFTELTEGKMALLISHRFSTVRMADEIFVLEDGRIVERGDHDRLTAVGGRYADMFELQAASYR
ncbi:MAG: ATP-binding cassette domain-containing protein [Acidobacteria bacterium]|nr:ATP-binding cassette domain-containing protein [Acidobacteriota bacterium]